jgi:hypothetical protein
MWEESKMFSGEGGVTNFFFANNIGPKHSEIKLFKLYFKGWDNKKNCFVQITRVQKHAVGKLLFFEKITLLFRLTKMVFLYFGITSAPIPF